MYGGRIEGEKEWKYKGPGGNPYDLEHKAFFEAIRSGNPLNCGDYMARSSQVAVMGQGKAKGTSLIFDNQRNHNQCCPLFVSRIVRPVSFACLPVGGEADRIV